MSAAFTPRLATSQQWTELPTELTLKVAKIFEDQFQLEASRGEFLVEGRIYPQELVMRLGYLETGHLRQINFEASMDLADLKETMTASARAGAASDAEEQIAKSKTMERLYSCIDALGSVMEEYFDLDPAEEEAIDVPEQWRQFDFEGETVYLQQSSVNTRLEEEANRLLGLDEAKDKGLFQEATQSEDALANAEIDSELAFEIQKAIREGTFKLPFEGFDGDDLEN